MIVEFCKWGNSLAVRIPKALADAIKASDGKRAAIKMCAAHLKANDGLDDLSPV